MKEYRTVVLNGQLIQILIRRNSQARRIIIRIDTTSGMVVLVLPPRESVANGLKFLQKHPRWLKHRLSSLPKRIPFTNGAIIPFQGSPHLISHEPNGPKRMQLAYGMIKAGGNLNKLSQRLTIWLRAEARMTITLLANKKTAEINCRPFVISIRDQKSRWGSCSSSGHLSFNWRLIMAPPQILDYVVAHESAHLIHMNHSVTFWELVAQMTNDVHGSKNWLKQHGENLHRYG